MALGIVAPAHVDDLEPYRARHRVLGAGITLGGAVAGAAGALYFGITAGVPTTVAAASMGLLVAAAGLLHMTLGANLYQARMAKRMVRRDAAARANATATES